MPRRSLFFQVYDVDEFHPAVHAGFLVDVLEVLLDRVAGDEQGFRDLRIVLAFIAQALNIQFPNRQAVLGRREFQQIGLRRRCRLFVLQRLVLRKLVPQKLVLHGFWTRRSSLCIKVEQRAEILPEQEDECRCPHEKYRRGCGVRDPCRPCGYEAAGI